MNAKDAAKQRRQANNRAIPDDVALRSLVSALCPACGRGKARRQSLCRSCYSALPSDLRNGLYRTIASGGYGPALRRALDRLGVRDPIFGDAGQGGAS